MFVKVALPLPIEPLTYSVPEELADGIELGRPVLVELRRKTRVGFVVGKNLPREGDYAIKPILQSVENHAAFDSEHLKFLHWLANYYHYPLGEVLSSALPPHCEEELVSWYKTSLPLESLSEEKKGRLQQRGGKRWALLDWLAQNGPSREIPEEWRAQARELRREGLVEEEKRRRTSGDTLPKASKMSSPPALREEQAAALKNIRGALTGRKFSPFLLEGVTGSGKTEIYIRAAEQALAEGGGVIVLVPEIALTPQLFDRFHSRLQTPIAILHSGLSDRERSRQWHLLNSGDVRIALGARSTILAPVKNIRLVIVDEEHESAFKQEDRLRYNARDVAILRAKLNQATIVLGSATPSLESYHHVKSGKYSLLRLENRVTANPLPEVEIVDLTKCATTGLLSPTLLREMRRNLEEKKQTMLLLNRRGFSSYLLCEDCGFVPQCRNCSVSLTCYMGKREVRCHYCGYQEPLMQLCPQCKSGKLCHGTQGTEALEAGMTEIFPSARVLRIDRESVQHKGALEKALLQIAEGAVDIIIGTQMIAKGHDFPNVSLVGVVNADASMNFPDFRAAEKSFQLFTQMAGRAGRGDFSGKVIIQSFHPEHPSVRFAAKHDFRSFAEQELKVRLQFEYPPYFRLARLLLTDPDSRKAQEVAEKIAQDLSGFAPNAGVKILGPAPSLLQRIQNRYRWNIVLKAKESTALNAIIKTVSSRWENKIPAAMNLSIDVDPSALF